MEHAMVKFISDGFTGVETLYQFVSTNDPFTIISMAVIFVALGIYIGKIVI